MMKVTYEHTKQNDFKVTLLESETQRFEVYSKFDGVRYRLARVLTYNKEGKQ